MRIKVLSGFTMVELMVVIAIMSIVFSIVIVDIRPDSNEKLRMAVERFVGDVKYVRNLSISRAAGTGGSYPAHGYGISLDLNNDAYVVYEADSVLGYKAGDDTIIKVVDLDSIYNGVVNLEGSGSDVYIEFISENDIEVSPTLVNTNYVLTMSNPSLDSYITIGEEADDGQLFITLNVDYSQPVGF